MCGRSKWCEAGTCGSAKLPDGHTDPSNVHGQGRDARRETTAAGTDTTGGFASATWAAGRWGLHLPLRLQL